MDKHLKEINKSKTKKFGEVRGGLKRILKMSHSFVGAPGEEVEEEEEDDNEVRNA